LWEIVGGAEKGGILVRRGAETTSPQEDERLGTGARVHEVELIGDRLHYKLSSGAGPREGWISIAIKDKTLARKCDGVETETLVPGRARPAPIGSRKIRILSLHGGGSNGNIGKYQTASFRSALKSARIDVEWDFFDGGKTWPLDAGGGDPEFLMRIAKDAPITAWYEFVDDDKTGRDMPVKLFDPSVTHTYTCVEEEVERARDYIRAKGPFDIICGYSQGAIMAHLITGFLRKDGEVCPWRLSLLFNGMRAFDDKYNYLFEEPFQQPAVLVFGRSDGFYKYGKETLPKLYVDPVILEHDQGHQYPSGPDSNEIYAEIGRQILWHCGQDPV